MAHDLNVAINKRLTAAIATHFHLGCHRHQFQKIPNKHTITPIQAPQAANMFGFTSPRSQATQNKNAAIAP
jgi:hypothetical protein